MGLSERNSILFGGPITVYIKLRIEIFYFPIVYFLCVPTDKPIKCPTVRPTAVVLYITAQFLVPRRISSRASTNNV